MTFEKLFADYCKSPQFKKLSSRSKQLYIYSGKRLEEFFGNKPVNKIKRSDLLKFQQSTFDRPAYSNITLCVASVVFSYALDMDEIEHNPAARLKKIKLGSHAKWTIEEVKEVIGLCDRRISTAVALAWYTGQRESDILSLRWSNFDGQYITLMQQKTNIEMRIKAHPDLIRYLHSIRGLEPDSAYIVSGLQRMSGPAFRNMLKRRLNKLGIKKVFHGIRKGVASSLAENGSPISEIAAIMGHKSIRMAAYYAEQANNKVLTENAVGNLTSCV